jgi:hypothetical protein
MAAVQEEHRREADDLYERFGKPLEAEHMGEYVAIFPDGRTVIGSTVGGVLAEATQTIGKGSYIFRIGQRWVWKLR